MSKYPTHRTSGRSEANYKGSGALHDRFTDAESVPSGGDDHRVMKSKSKSHNNPSTKAVRGPRAGETPSPTQIMHAGGGGGNAKPHGFRCHPTKPNIMRDNFSAPEMFNGKPSGNECAHRLGCKGGKFGHSRFGIAGLSHDGKRDCAGNIEGAKSPGQKRQGHKSQPKPRNRMRDNG